MFKQAFIVLVVYLLSILWSDCRADFSPNYRAANINETQKVEKLIRETGLDWFAYDTIQVVSTSQGDLEFALLANRSSENLCRLARMRIVTGPRISHIKETRNTDYFIAFPLSGDCAQDPTSYAATGMVTLPDSLAQLVFRSKQHLLSSVLGKEVNTNGFELASVEFLPIPDSKEVGLLLAYTELAGQETVRVYTRFDAANIQVLSTTTGATM